MSQDFNNCKELRNDLRDKVELFLIHAKAGNGKTYTARLLKNELEAKGYRVFEMPLARHMKNLLRDFFGYKDNKDYNGRKLLQHFGTNHIRNKFDIDFHIDTLINDMLIVSSYVKSEKIAIIVPDVRFENELLSLLWFAYSSDWEAKSIYLISDYYDEVVADNEDLKKHPSEGEVSIDFFSHVIYNGDDVKEQLEELLYE